MRVSKILYILNALAVINLLKTCWCNNELYASETQDLEKMEQELEAKEKRKKIILYSSIAGALALAATALGVGIYVAKRKRKSVWDKIETGKVGYDILLEVIDKAEKKTQDAMKGGKSFEKSLPTSKELKKMFNEMLKEKGDGKISSSQRRELMKMVPFIHYRVKESVHKKINTK